MGCRITKGVTERCTARLHLTIMDDTFIHSTAEEHMDNLMDLFKVLRKYGLKLSPHKCQFFKKKIVYMGLEFQIQEDKVCYTPLKDKCDTIRNLESPKTLRQTT